MGNHESVAVVGIGCRFPIGADAASYWDALCGGVDGIREVPPSRWRADDFFHPDPKAPGKMTVRKGGFIDDIDLVDWRSLAISPREAIQMDPQQRLLLEVSWEALEDAGTPIDALRDTDAGVYVGIYRCDYETLMAQQLTGTDPYSLSGIALAFAANRISHFLGCRGPSLAIEVGCAGSLIAVHLAARAIWSGECEVALAGGAMLNIVPEHFVRFSKSGFLSPDERCATFDVDANGFIPAEGAGMVVLKSLERARLDGDRIYAVIRGSSSNHNGPNDWIMQTSQSGQEHLIRRALKDAGLSPDDIDFVEMHGTGTKFGDPVEAASLGSVFGGGRSEQRKLLVGSVKTNMGHLQSASGIAHFIKAVLALEHGVIPPSLHLKKLNPRIAPEWHVECPQTVTPWPDTGGRPRRAGVTALSLGGGNAHVVLEQAPVVDDEPRQSRDVALHLLPLSSRSAESLAQTAVRYADFLSSSDVPLKDVCYSAGVTRAHHGERATIIGKTRDDMVRGLRSLAQGTSTSHVAQGSCDPDAPAGVVFVFPGQGGQWLGMGRRLLEESDAFRAAMEQCDAIIRAEAGWSVLDELMAAEDASRLSDIDRAQPLIFSVQVALAALWRSLGIEPVAVLGHSMGEVAAAFVAGALTLEDAARVICRRSRLLRKVAGKGGMAVVDLSVEQAEAEIAPFADVVSVAAANSPRSTVIAGAVDALEKILAALESRGVFCRLVKVDVASHSPQMDPLRDDLLEALSSVKPRAGSVPIYSTVLARVVDGSQFDASYWEANLRRPVRLVDVVRAAVEDDCRLFIEMSPHPTLIPALQDTFAEYEDRRCGTVGSLRRDHDDVLAFYESLSALYLKGRQLPWLSLNPEARRTKLPTYGWHRTRLWLPDPDETAATLAGNGPTHPILGQRIDLPHNRNEHIYETTVSRRSHPWVCEHRVQGEVLFPGTGFLRLAHAAGEEIFGRQPFSICEVTFQQPLFVPEESGVVLQLAVTIDGARGASFVVHSRAAKRGVASEWTSHVTGHIEMKEADQSATSATRPRAYGEV